MGVFASLKLSLQSKIRLYNVASRVYIVRKDDNFFMDTKELEKPSHAN